MVKGGSISANKAKSTLESIIKQADANLLKEMTKLLNRIEKILVPVDSVVHNDIGDRLSKISRRLKNGHYFEDVNEFKAENVVNVLSKNSESILRKINWDLFENELKGVLSNGDEEYAFPKDVLNDLILERNVHEDRLFKAMKKEKVRQLQYRNNQPVMPGKWRKEPFTSRSYELIHNYVVTNSIKETEVHDIVEQLNTPLDGYLGQAYNYDDHTLTEEWMKSFKDKNTSGPTDDDVIRTQLSSLLEIMTAQVQDRVCNEIGVLHNQPLVLGVDVKEVPVWGIDCYTRKMIEISIVDKIPQNLRNETSIKKFVELVLLPTINQQPSDLAHNMSYSLQSIIDNPDSTTLYKMYARVVLEGFYEYGMELFRIHPKGTGVICIRPEGIPPHVFVTEYLGELYPSYRWCEKLDVVEQAQEKFELKPTLPDFYNILLERPRQDPNGYGLLYVDASQRANIGSSCSHSCESNCTSAVVARNGKLCIVLTTNRYIHYGEELTMDYYSITTSDIEWRAAICLCGMTSCRGSFLHYATQDDLQQVLNQNYGPLLRYASLLRACSPLPITEVDTEALSRHGVQKVVLGENPPQWVVKYAADILRFIEYERRALPCALMRCKDEQANEYTYPAADMDARCVMEQRIQSMVCCFSMISQVLSKQSKTQDNENELPLVVCTTQKVKEDIWKMISTIPELIEIHWKKPIVKETKDSKPQEDSKEEVAAAVLEIKALLQEFPPTMAKLRETLLEIRRILLQIENHSTSKARFGQLADILVLWTFTSNFSAPQEYEVVKSDPITVVARELGVSVPRTKIFRAYENEYRNTRKRIKSPEEENKLRDHAFETNSNPTSEVDACNTTTESILPLSPSEPLIDEMELTSEPIIEVNQPSEVIHSPEEFSSSETMEIEKSEDEVQTSFVEESSALVEDISMIVEDTTSSNGIEEAQPNKSKNKEFYLSPNEPVFIGSKSYHPRFCFWQLIGWFNAGTDQKVENPNLFGCVQLPDPATCFGNVEVNYGEKQRETLLNILKDDKKQTMPWPIILKNSFNVTESRSINIFGSPMLDVALGQVDAIYKVLQEFRKSNKTQNSKDNKKSKRTPVKNLENVQFDEILPPEMPTSWVQCDDCKKWRRVPWHINPDDLSDTWVCTMNTWDSDAANCLAPQDDYDPSKENTLDYHTPESVKTLESFVIGTWRDVYCIKNHVYYEAQVKQIKKSKKGSPKILFHYRGWSRAFDDWIEFDSDRIQAHNMFTNPEYTDPRDQEAWQGMDPVKSKLISSFKVNKPAKKESKKRSIEEVSLPIPVDNE